MKSLESRFFEKVEKTAECWLWRGAVNANGYGSFGIDGKPRTASRVAFELAYGSIPQGMWVLHHCDNPLCVRPDHLYAGTHQQNMADKARRGRGRSPPGEQNHNAKLTRDAVLAIRASRGVSPYALARQYGVVYSTIARVRKGEAWAHV